MKTLTTKCLLLSLLLIAKMSYAECTEYKIVDHGDSVEAVCVGKALNEYEKKDFEKQKKRDEKAALQQAIDECNKITFKPYQYGMKSDSDKIVSYDKEEKKRCDELRSQQSIGQVIEVGARGNCQENCSNEHIACLGQCGGKAQCMGYCIAAKERCVEKCY